MRPGPALSSLLTHRRLPAILALLAVLLALPSLGTGWQLDDLFHRWMVAGSAREGMPGWPQWNLFTFLDGDQARTGLLMDTGIVPWWTERDILLSFWRPLTTVTHRVDYLLWPGSPALMHLHSLLWLGAVTAAAALLFRRVMGTAAPAGLAALLYAVDGSHGFPAGWIANRNALIGVFFGLLAVSSHVKARRGGKTVSPWPPLWLGLGLLSSEAALGAGAYLLSWELFLGPGTWKRRLAALAPYLAVAAVWQALYSLGGHGARGSGFYVHPLGDTLRYLASLPGRAAVLLLGQWAWPPSDIALYLTGKAAKVYFAVAASFVVVLAAALHFAVGRSKDARFWAVGMILSLAPVCATFPSDRLLLFTGIGAAALLSLAAGSLFSKTQAATLRPVPRRVLQAFFAVLLLVNGPLSALSFPFNVKVSKTAEPYVQGAFRSLGPFSGRETVIFVNPPVPFFAGYLPIVAALEGKEGPRAVRVLAAGRDDLLIERIDGKTVRVRPEEGFLRGTADLLFRRGDAPFQKGEKVVLAGLTVTVTETDVAGRPLEALFAFDVPLEDASLRFVLVEEGRYRPFIPPAPGDRTVVAGYGMFPPPVE